VNNPSDGGAPGTKLRGDAGGSGGPIYVDDVQILRVFDKVTFYNGTAGTDVTYRVNYTGSSITATGVLESDPLGTYMPADPVKEGYIFGGWYTERDGAGSEFTDETPVTQDTLELYAYWIESTTDGYDVLVALYSKEGRLISVEICAGVEGGGYVSVDVNLDIPSIMDSESYVKVFFWDLETYIPYRPAVTFPSNDDVTYQGSSLLIRLD